MFGIIKPWAGFGVAGTRGAQLEEANLDDSSLKSSTKSSSCFSSL